MGEYAQFPEQQGGWVPSQGYPPAPYAPQQLIYPVNPAAYPLLDPIPVVRQRDFGPVVVYFILIAVILGVGVADLGFTHWMSYCAIDIGLLKYTFMGSSMDLRDVANFFCLIPFHFEGCGDTCEITKSLYKAGVITFSLGIAALTSLLLSVVFLAVLLCKPRWSLLGYSVRGALALGGFLWIAGSITYWVYFGQVKEETSDTEVEAGLGLAGVVAGLLVLAAVVGMVAVSKAQLPVHSS